MRDPKVFLLDEPLSNLDAKLRVQTRAEISRLHQATGTTFIYVTHDQVEAMTMGDRIAVFNAGVIQQLGTPGPLRYARESLRRGLYRQPRHESLQRESGSSGCGVAAIIANEGAAATTWALRGRSTSNWRGR